MTTRFHSIIADRLMTRTLWRGTAVAVIGVLILAIFGSQMPPDQLKIWGLPLLIVAVILVALGLIPYRQLAKLRSRPDEIFLDEAGLTYIRRRERLLTVPYDAIKRVGYEELRGLYGLGIWLEDPASEPVQMHVEYVKFEQLERMSKKRFGCEIFLPFFLEKDCVAIESQLAEHRASVTAPSPDPHREEPAAP